jgi:hypothetical protein
VFRKRWYGEFTRTAWRRIRTSAAGRCWEKMAKPRAKLWSCFRWLIAGTIRHAIAKELRLEVVGWYHSHPDAPARPSEFDREHAWPWYSYIIVSVQRREPCDTTSWRLRDDRSAYDSEAIESVAQSASI